MKDPQEILDWFLTYSHQFLPDQELKGKIKHTKRVLAICEKVMDSDEDYPNPYSPWNEEEKKIMKIIAILHDVGRFVQKKEYGTFNDLNSTDHGYVGVKIIEKYNLLKGYRKDISWLIKSCIYHHNKLLSEKIPLYKNKFYDLLCQADRYDIVKNNTPYCNVLDEINFIKEELIISFWTKKGIEYNLVQTSYEWALFQLNWLLMATFPYIIEKSEPLVKNKMKILQKSEAFHSIYPWIIKIYPNLQT